MTNKRKSVTGQRDVQDSGLFQLPESKTNKGTDTCLSCWINYYRHQPDTRVDTFDETYDEMTWRPINMYKTTCEANLIFDRFLVISLEFFRNSYKTKTGRSRRNKTEFLSEVHLVYFHKNLRFIEKLQRFKP